jgi:AraC-like DNA-binding protein
MRDVLLNNLHLSPKLEEIAYQMGLNRNKLNEKFKVLFGDTVFAWLREQRLQRARELLQDKTLSIQEIAEQVGFTSQAQLSRMFKLRFGQSPREYRISVIENNPLC